MDAVRLDPDVLDTVMPGLVGHDTRPSAVVGDSVLPTAIPEHQVLRPWAERVGVA